MRHALHTFLASPQRRADFLLSCTLPLGGFIFSSILTGGGPLWLLPLVALQAGLTIYAVWTLNDYFTASRLGFDAIIRHGGQPRVLIVRNDADDTQPEN